MTLKEMCEQVAVYTDRRDDFVTITGPGGQQVYDPDDDPGAWFEAMKGSINNAYREVARRLLMPDVIEDVTLGEGGSIDLLEMSPDAQKVKAVYSADGSGLRGYRFETKYRIIVDNGREGEEVRLQYYYVPAPLERFTDEPVFPEGLVDPMVYISLAASDLWYTERKIDIAREWQSRYYSLLSSIRGDMRSSSDRRIKRSIFR